MIGLPSFIVGSIALGLVLVGVYLFFGALAVATGGKPLRWAPVLR